LDIYESNGGLPRQRIGDRTRRIDSDVKPKYTTGGLKYTTRDHKCKTKGWTTEGIKRYNELFLMVTNDRRRRPEFMKKFKEEKKKTIETTRKRKKSTGNVKAIHSMWEDQDIATKVLHEENEQEKDSDSDSDEGVAVKI
jgi:hypothetical protein